MHTFLYTQLYLQLPILIIHNAYTNYVGLHVWVKSHIE